MSHLSSSKELEILKQHMVASLDVIHDYLPKISETVAVIGTKIEQESMSCPFCVNCQVFDLPFRFPLPLDPQSNKLYYNTYSRSPSEVRQYCRNEYSLKLSEKQCRDNRIEPIVHIGILKL